MKALLFFLILSFPAISLSQENVEAVKNLIELYQDEAQSKTGHLMEVIFEKENRFLANAKLYENGAIIRIYAGMVKELAPLELVTIACHELGHILGDIKKANLINGEVRTFREAVEGEADYFAGGCLRRYLKTIETQESAKKIATSAYNKLMRLPHPIRPELAVNLQISGVLPAYPNPECRLLTVLYGIEKKHRPKCWYNPGVESLDTAIAFP